jgi:hypothetical protein
MTQRVTPTRAGTRAGAQANLSAQMEFGLAFPTRCSVASQLAWPAAYVARRYRVNPALAPTIVALAGIGGAA